MTLKELQEELARRYIAVGEKARFAAEHAKHGRYPQAYRYEAMAVQEMHEAEALWPEIVKTAKEKTS